MKKAYDASSINEFRFGQKLNFGTMILYMINYSFMKKNSFFK